MASWNSVGYDDEWIREHFTDVSTTKELCELYNKTFGTGIIYRTFQSHCNRELKLNEIRKSINEYTEEMDSWLEEHYYSEGSYCFNDFNKKFHQNRSHKAILTHCKRKGFRVNLMVANEHTYKNAKREHEIGDIWVRTNGNQVYKVIKIAKVFRDTNASVKKLSHYVWEQEHGPIPKGHKIIFLNNDSLDCRLENLACVPTHYLALMNKQHLKSEDPRITETAIKWCELYSLVKD